MTPRERKLRIENHPDKWGGDHSRMEKVFAVVNRSQSKSDIKSCRICGVPTRGETCRTHMRHRQVLPDAFDKALEAHWRMAVLFLLTLFISTSAFAQRGTNIKPEPTIGTLALPVPVFRQQYFGWNAPAGSSNKVYWGLARDAWTNGSAPAISNLRFTNSVGTVFTNAFPWTNGWHYRVTAMVAGVESTPALWPSNRIGGDIWLVGYATNMTQPTNIVKLISYKGNNPPGNMRMWGVVDLTTGWE